MIFINNPNQLSGNDILVIFATINGETDIFAVPLVETKTVFSFAEITGQADIEAVLFLFDTTVFSFADFTGETSILAVARARNAGGQAEFTGETNIFAVPLVALILVNPEPILTEISSTAFDNQRIRTRFKIDGLEVPIKSFEYSKPKSATGSSLNIVLNKADLALLPSDAVFSFEIGKYISGSWVYFPLISNAILDARGYNLAFLNDTLSFSTVSPLADLLELCPRKNTIVYNPSQVQINLDETELLFDTLGNQILTELQAINGLNLYHLLQIAFVDGCGFDSFETNLPNFPVTRLDFSFTNSYLDAIASVIGVFEPVLFEIDNVIWILDKTQAIPEDFEPNPITASKMLTFGANKSSSPLIDGFLVSYTDLENSANYSENRIVQNTTETGNFGDSDFTSTEQTQTFKDWKNTDFPNLIVKSDLISEVNQTFVDSQEIGRTTETHFFDGQGKRTESRKTTQSLTPLLPNGELSLQTVRTEITQFFYKNDRNNPNKFVIDKSILRVSGKIAKDSDNQYFSQDFKQDYLEAHKAGNLSDAMTAETGAIKTVIEQFEQLGNGQIQTRITTIDHLRNAITNSFSDVKTGEISLNSISKPRQVVIWRVGYDTDQTKGARIQTFSVGELPLFFALPLAERRLARQLNKPQTATITVNGFDENLERGIYFAAQGRFDAILGNFLTEGFSIRGENGQPIQTIIEATEI